MTSEANKKDQNQSAGPDHFWLQRVYPEARESFLYSQRPIDEIKATCLVVLDANVLLMPYRMGAQSLDELKKVYSDLASKERLFVPGQAAREFLKNRANRIRDVARELNNQASLIQAPMDKPVGFLENEESFRQLQKLANDIKSLKKEVLDKTRELTLRLRSDVGSDPVSLAYHEVLKDSVVELGLDEKGKISLIEEMRWRYNHDIPPGYGDETKADGGIGDLIIWKTILKLGSDKKHDCIFVTEDAKSDWWVKSEGTFQPRIELIEEYRKATNGKTIHLVPLSELLLLFGAKADAVDDTKRVEETKPRVIPRPSSQPPLAIATSPILELLRRWQELELPELMELNAGLSDIKRQKSIEHNRLKSQTENRDLVAQLTQAEFADLYRQREAVWEEFRYYHQQHREIEKRVKELLFDT